MKLLLFVLDLVTVGDTVTVREVLRVQLIDGVVDGGSSISHAYGKLPPAPTSLNLFDNNCPTKLLTKELQ